MKLDELFELLNLSNLDEDDPRLKPYQPKLDELWSRWMKVEYKGKTYFIPRCYYEQPKRYIQEKYNV